MNNLITYAEALWDSGILPALLILAIGYLSKNFSNNRRLVELLKIASRAVQYAEVTFDGGQTQKAQAIKQIDDAIETAVKTMKEAEK